MEKLDYCDDCRRLVSPCNFAFTVTNPDGQLEFARCVYCEEKGSDVCLDD